MPFFSSPVGNDAILFDHHNKHQDGRLNSIMIRVESGQWWLPFMTIKDMIKRNLTDKKASQADLFDYCDIERICSLKSCQGQPPQSAICPISVGAQSELKIGLAAKLWWLINFA